MNFCIGQDADWPVIWLMWYPASLENGIPGTGYPARLDIVDQVVDIWSKLKLILKVLQLIKTCKKNIKTIFIFLNYKCYLIKILPSFTVIISLNLLNFTKNVDPDPGGIYNADPCGSGSTTLACAWSCIFDEIHLFVQST